MVARLVQQHDIRGGEQHLRQEQATLLTAAECRDGPMVFLLAEAETIEDFLDMMIDVIGIMVPQQLIEAIVSRSQRGALSVVAGAGQGFGGADHVIVGGDELIQRAAGLREKRLIGIEVGVLLEQADAGAGVQAGFAVIGLIETGQKPEHCRLAGAVGPDQAHTVAAMQLEGNILEERALVEAPRQVIAAQ
jgi:hypothetical protein